VAGTLTFESDHPLQIKELLPEGIGMKKITITDCWTSDNAGGCGNFGKFDKNPAYCINITGECDVKIRLRVTEEMAVDGYTVISNSDNFSFCVNAMAYRIQSNRWPPAPGSINIKSLTNPILNTYNGKYTNNLSACVS